MAKKKLKLNFDVTLYNKILTGENGKKFIETGEFRSVDPYEWYLGKNGPTYAYFKKDEVDYLLLKHCRSGLYRVKNKRYMTIWLIIEDVCIYTLLVKMKF